MGVPDERIVLLGRDDNFWQSGPTGPCGPCSELYSTAVRTSARTPTAPGTTPSAHLEFWNLVFMQYELQADGSLPELPTKNIDTGMGLERMSAILQDVESVFETDLFRPLIELGEELSGRRYGQDFATTRALRILADHGTGGDLPARRRGGALQRGPRLHPAPHHATRDPAGPRARHRGVVPAPLYEHGDRADHGDAYPELEREWPTIERWARAEEESFGRTLEQGERLLGELVDAAKAEQHLLGVRRGRVQAARHLWLPL